MKKDVKLANTKPFYAGAIGSTLAVLILLALFIFPPARISKICDFIIPRIEDARAMALDEDFVGALSVCEEMASYLDGEYEFLYSFIDHEHVAELEDNINACIDMAHTESADQFLSELWSFRITIETIKHIESIKSYSFL